jgi:hypothetical protein
MTSRTDSYRTTLLEQVDWEAYLLHNSCLPGPRANLELAWVAAQAGTAAQFDAWLDHPPELAPENTPLVFLVVCGTLGLGEQMAAGQFDRLPDLRRLANDPRWRVREAAAMALQRWGQADRGGLLSAMWAWSLGSLLEQRAAAAALCEPFLLEDSAHTRAVLDLLDAITAALIQNTDRRSEDFRVLRKGLGYCWSVAIAAYPEYGRPLFERWLANPDSDLRWVLRENLKKARLSRKDPAWVAECQSALAGESRT